MYRKLLALLCVCNQLPLFSCTSLSHVTCCIHGSHYSWNLATEGNCSSLNPFKQMKPHKPLLPLSQFQDDNTSQFKGCSSLSQCEAGEKQDAGLSHNDVRGLLTDFVGELFSFVLMGTAVKQPCYKRQMNDIERTLFFPPEVHQHRAPQEGKAGRWRPHCT